MQSLKTVEKNLHSLSKGKRDDLYGNRASFY